MPVALRRASRSRPPQVNADRCRDPRPRRVMSADVSRGSPHPRDESPDQPMMATLDTGQWAVHHLLHEEMHRLRPMVFSMRSRLPPHNNLVPSQRTSRRTGSRGLFPLLVVTSVALSGCAESADTQQPNAASKRPDAIVTLCIQLFEQGKQGGGLFPPPTTRDARESRCEVWQEQGFLDSRGKLTPAGELAL